MTDLNQCKQGMEKAIAAFKQDVTKIRTGRASLSMLDGVYVEAYGSRSPINQVATLNTPEARLITIAPWDKSLIAVIEKAIQQSDLGINPINDGNLIRLNIPTLNEERRKEMVKLVKKNAEESKIRIRNERRDAMNELKKAHDSKQLPEDEWHDKQDEVQKLTDGFVAQIDSLAEQKEKDILSI